MQKADFLRALAKKGETPAEIAAFVNEFLKLAVDPGLDRAKLPGPMLDVVGTGGDQLHLFNVSTTAMFILAAGGVCVTKHGNRGITSKAGGADVLEALGIKIDLPKEKVVAGIEKTGLGFFLAPLYHPAFKAVVEARKLLAEAGYPDGKGFPPFEILINTSESHRTLAGSIRRSGRCWPASRS